MKSLFSSEINGEVIERINNLSPDSKPQWGKMAVSQMIAHCRVPLENAFGDIKLKKSLMGILFGRIAKRSIFKDEPFKQNLPTDKRFIFTDNLNFDDEKLKLINNVRRFTGGPSIITKDAHPFFGKMTPEQWDILMSKHLDHHLRQFGV